MVKTFEFFRAKIKVGWDGAVKIIAKFFIFLYNYVRNKQNSYDT